MISEDLRNGLRAWKQAIEQEFETTDIIPYLTGVFDGLGKTRTDDQARKELLEGLFYAAISYIDSKSEAVREAFRFKLLDENADEFLKNFERMCREEGLVIP